MPLEKPLPVRQLILICAVRFAEPISFSIHVPFIYFMVRDFSICPETEIGYYVGMIASTFSISQLISSMPIGMLSDRLGRRPVVLSGLATTIIGIVSFGLSKSFAWALCTKIATGLLDNSIAVLKSMVSEVTSAHSETQRARAFSLLQVVFGLGGIVGAGLGGYLSDPVHRYPNVFGKGGPVTVFLTEYPYSLPCFVAAAIASIGWVAGFLFLEETLVRTKASTSKATAEEQEPLVPSTEETESYQTFNDTNRPAEVIEKPAVTSAVLAVCLTYGLIAYQMVFYDELFPIWSASEWSVGGLGLTSKEIGTVLSFAGFVTLFIQFFVYHRLTAWFGTLRLLRLTLFICIFVFGLQGFIRYLANQSSALLWTGLLLNMGLKTIAQTVTITGSIILVNNAAPRKDALGTINALSQCCSSATRALGPISSGTVWSIVISAAWIPLSVRSQLSWLILACVGVITFTASMMLKSQYYTRA